VRVAIVGAGIAGLAAARALVDRQHDVTIFERAPIAGGRVGTKMIKAIELPRGLSGELAFDHGAQYFTVRDQRFSELAAEWDRDRVIARWTGQIVMFDGEGWEELEDDTVRYAGIPGMSAIVNAMTAGLDIKYGQRIESLEPLQRDFDHVIVSVPAPLAVPLVAHLPALAGKAASVAMQPNWTVMAAFEQRVAARFDAAFVNGSAVNWIARNSSKPRRNWQIETWVIQASPTWSLAHRDDQPDDVGAFLMEAFEDLIPAGLPRAFYATVHRWRHAAADPPLASGAIHDPDSKITLCGDWCKGPRLEDAYLSGLAAAEGVRA
jgi:predicted NAD/FAD-dependent oxidoreductase